MPDRATLIRLIHVARRDLQMAEDAYRQVVRKITRERAESAKDCTDEELEAVMKHMRRCGFRIRHRTGAGTKPTKPRKPASRPLADHAQDKKIRALWLFLNQLGVVRDPSEQALASYVKRLTRVDALQWLNASQTETVIEALKKWAMRFLPERLNTASEQLRADWTAGKIALDGHTINGLNFLLAQARDRNTYDTTLAAWEAVQEVRRCHEAQQK